MTGKAGVVYLVGAGPGDPGLITMHGAAKLRVCDAVVYDTLANPVLLDLTQEAQRIDVGKKPGVAPTPQPQITAMLTELARAGKTVVRLKGGDPFVFGRGGEEAVGLAEAGCRFEVVPGITAAIAASAYGRHSHHVPRADQHVRGAGHRPRGPGQATHRHRLARVARIGTVAFYMSVSLPHRPTADRRRHGRRDAGGRHRLGDLPAPEHGGRDVGRHRRQGRRGRRPAGRR